MIQVNPTSNPSSSLATSCNRSVLSDDQRLIFRSPWVRKVFLAFLHWKVRGWSLGFNVVNVDMFRSSSASIFAEATFLRLGSFTRIFLYFFLLTEQHVPLESCLLLVLLLISFCFCLYLISVCFFVALGALLFESNVLCSYLLLHRRWYLAVSRLYLPSFVPLSNRGVAFRREISLPRPIFLFSYFSFFLLFLSI